jgi:hypothetical protein
MIEILATTDPVRLHFLRSLLEEADIQVFVFDAGGQWPGAFPARLMVAADDEALARRLIAEAERGL